MCKSKSVKIFLCFSITIVTLLFMAGFALPAAAGEYVLKLNKNELTLTVGEEEILTVVESVPKYQSTMWNSSNPEVVKVSSYGDVKAYGEGTAVITATNGYASFECRVTVTGQQQAAIESIILNPASVKLKIGDTIAPNAVITPSSISAENITWTSSNPAVATVQRGIIRAVSGGNAVITAGIMGKSAACTVEVAGNATGIVLNKSDLVLRPMAHETLTAQIIPANSIDTKITWSTSNPQVATVDNSGGVLAYSDGVAIITAEAGGYTADCRVKVQTEVEWVSIEPHRVDLKVGETAQIYANVLPRNAISSGFTWTSLNPEIASVNSEGRVSALKEGITLIYAESDGKKCNTPARVTVAGYKEEEVIKKDEIVYPLTIRIEDHMNTHTGLKKGDELSLYVVPVPINANQLDGFKPISWESSNPAVASVSSSGTVKFLSGGSVTITATTANKRLETAISLRAGDTSLPAVLKESLNSKVHSLMEILSGNAFREKPVLIATGVRG